MAVARFRICDGLEDEGIAAAATRHRVAATITDNGVVSGAAFERIRIHATNEVEGIMRRTCEFQRPPPMECRMAKNSGGVGDQRPATAVARQYEVRGRVVAVRKHYAIDCGGGSLDGFENRKRATRVRASIT